MPLSTLRVRLAGGHRGLCSDGKGGDGFVLFCLVFTIVMVASRALKQGMEMRAKFST